LKKIEKIIFGFIPLLILAIFLIAIYFDIKHYKLDNPNASVNLRPSLVLIRGEIVINRKVIKTLGTGFFIRDDLIVTALHNTKDRLNLSVSFDDGEIENPIVVYTDPLNDLSFLKVKNKKPPLPVASDVKIKQNVWFIGFNRFFRCEIHKAKILMKLKKFDFLPNYLFNDTLLVDHNFEPGNSGGPVLNKNGEVVGLIVATSTFLKPEEQYGIAINSREILKDLEKIK